MLEVTGAPRKGLVVDFDHRHRDFIALVRNFILPDAHEDLFTRDRHNAPIAAVANHGQALGLTEDQGLAIVPMTF